MSSIILNNKKVIGDYQNPYIVAEFNSSHNGDVEVAKEMVDAALICGCDCVKFQSWSSSSLYSEEYYKNNRIAKRIIEKVSLPPETLLDIKNYCDYKKIDFSSTPYSEAEVDFLVEKCDVPFLKIASMDINNLQFLKYAASKNRPIILSTGMADMREVRKAVEVIRGISDAGLCLLHCVSLYPTPIESINLNGIIGLRKDFPGCVIGFSDHTLGHTMDVAAVALGSAVIEKHFTLDKKKNGMDNNMAMEPDEFSDLVKECRVTYGAMGMSEKSVSSEEIQMRERMRRSIVASRDILAGEVLSEDDIEYKRPGDGMSPDRVDEVLGKRLINSVAKGFLIRESDLKD